MVGGKGLIGDQLVLEGLIADILNEHFGEGVELIGIALFRNGSMSFPELVKVCNLRFLGFPRDVVNRFSQFNHSGSDSMAFKLVRDSLLVLIHYGLVSFAPSYTSSPSQTCMYYTLREAEVINRLSLAEFLELVEDPEEKHAMEQVLKRGRMKRSKLIEYAKGKGPVDLLLAERVLVTLEPVSSAVIGYHGSELQLGVIKKLMVRFYEAKLDKISAEVISALLDTVRSENQSVSGDLSVGDISSRVTIDQKTSSSTSLISTLIKLQQKGYISKKQHFSTTSASEQPLAKKKRISSARAPNIKQQLTLVAEEKSKKDDEGGMFFENLLTNDANPNTAGGPLYCLKLVDLLDEMESELCFELVKAKFGPEAARVYELLSSSGQKSESSHVAEICAISRESAIQHLHALAVNGLCQIQEVPKVVATGASSAAAAAGGGLSAMMRAVSSSFWLYSTDTEKARKFFITLIANSIINLRRRFRCEVNRQCKLEDRASNLTAKEKSYLESVSAAQDVLEGSALDLVASLQVLLFRSRFAG